MPRKVRIGAGMTAREYATLTEVREIAEMFDRIGGDIEQRGLFGVVSSEAESVCRSILAEASSDEKVDNPQELARPILKFIEAARDAIERGDADRAARWAFVAGMEWGRATMKWAWEPDALRGERVAGGERNAAAETNKRHEPKRDKRLARMRELTASTMRVSKAAAQCEAEGLGPRGAIERQWNRWVKKSDT
jgi:hypothetical protein